MNFGYNVPYHYHRMLAKGRVKEALVYVAISVAEMLFLVE